jgi:hypothetical protein
MSPCGYSVAELESMRLERLRSGRGPAPVDVDELCAVLLASVRRAQEALRRGLAERTAEPEPEDSYRCACGVFIPDPEDPNCPCG